MGPRTVHALGLISAALFAAIPAHAICGRPPPIHVWPHRGVPVPTNAHVFMTAPATWRADATMTLVTAPRKDRPTERTGLKEQSWRAAGTERFELTPLSPLLPSTTYELRSSRGEILGVFTTSVIEDKHPPTWGGLRSGRVWKERRGPGVTVSPECGNELVLLEGPSQAIDDQTQSVDIRYALWAARAGAPIDYGSPPLTWTTRDRDLPTRFTLQYGSSSPEEMDFELPKDRPLRVGVKAYDLAANATDASEVTLE